MLQDIRGNPFFSVVIPLYNKENYISRAVKSVIDQEFDDLELIVVDDGSTDKSGFVVESFDDPRVKLVRQSNQGEGPARNAGVSLAKGDWVAFLDGDDMWLPNHLSSLRSVISEFPDIGIVSTRPIEHKNDQLPVEPAVSLSGGIGKINYFKEASKNIGVINSSSVAVKKDVFFDVGGFENYKMGCDLEYWARVSLKYSLAVSDEATSVYFRGTGGVMESGSANIDVVPRPLPTGLSDLSPSVRMLYDWVKGGVTERNAHMYSSVVEYINSRVDAAVRSAFVRRDSTRVKALGKLYIVSGGGRDKKWRRISLLPSPAINALASIRYMAKYIYYKVKW